MVSAVFHSPLNVKVNLKVSTAAASLMAINAIKTEAACACPTGANGQFGYKDVAPVLAQRCTSCHGAQLQMKGVRLDTPAAVQRHAQAIYQQAVVAKTMPLNNATGMTEAERAVLKAWFEAGAAVP